MKSKAPRSTPSVEDLSELLDYNPETGELFWKERPVRFFEGNEGSQKSWNTKYAGGVAGSPKRGVWRTNIQGVGYLCHRLIWKLMTGREAEFIDHINGNPLDNRWANLRAVTHQENMQNRKVTRTNKTGYMGIHRQVRGGGFYARIGKRYLGCFRTFDEAYRAKKKAETEHGYHQNHGRVSC